MSKSGNLWRTFDEIERQLREKGLHPKNSKFKKHILSLIKDGYIEAIIVNGKRFLVMTPKGWDWYCKLTGKSGPYVRTKVNWNE